MKNIATALVKAQKGFAPALKSSTNPHFKSKYADLAACVEAVIDSLNDNGIAMIQRTHEDANGITVETVFVHESGEMLESGKLHVPASKQDPQGYGSALTYARRYSLMAACGIAPEDDDGNAASKPKRESAQSVAQSDFDKLPLAKQKEYLSAAADIIESFGSESPDVAYDYYLQFKSDLDDTAEQAAWRGCFPSNIRTAFQKIYTKRQSETMETQS